MPKDRHAKSGYARLAQTEEEEDVLDDSDHEDFARSYAAISSPSTRYAPIQSQRRQDRMSSSGHNSPSSRRPLTTRPRRSNSGVDIKAINARLERWADEIASKFKRRKGKGIGQDDEQPEIQHSVFQAPDWIRPATTGQLNTVFSDPPGLRMSKEEFEDLVESVRVAIELGIHPKLISQGSSGSYFAQNSDGKVLGVFKPKDEEPYASRNPKWTKWIHRNLFPFFFGRACLIPNLSYVSEAAAYTLDTQLRTNLVPYTDVVGLSSKSFSYDFWDRRAYYRKKKPLPEKLGSFQVFLKGYKDATLFLKDHPWPDQHNSGFRPVTPQRKRKRRWAEDCRPGGPPSDGEEGEDSDGTTQEESGRQRVFWSDSLQQSFRVQLEKLVVLDYIMRNTDRGLDNWMIRIDEQKQEASIVAEPSRTDSVPEDLLPSINGHPVSSDEQYRRQEQMKATSRSGTPLHEDVAQTVRIGAIDNSLSWPWKHPDAWRSYPFGWLFLPVSLIGEPFSETTRRHFLPLLTSKAWWSETQAALRRCFMQDADFQEKMFSRQMAVMKGQAWNVVETLKTPDHGPLELTRRARVYVWDDLVDVPVAVPLQIASGENRKRDNKAREEQEEMDISAARASAPQPEHVLLDSNASKPGLNPNGHFNTSRQNSRRDVRQSMEREGGPLSPDSLKAMADGSPSITKAPSQEYFGSRPANRARMSFEDPRRTRDGPSSWQSKRRFSLSARSMMNAFLEDDEGDLGYAAAEDRESSQKKVIVERLEPVKSRKPFFTWC